MPHTTVCAEDVLLCCSAWFLAGLFCVLTWSVTLYEVALHLEYYSRPALQRHIIRIMLMPPIYALDSWFCLRFVSARTVLTPIRELYEAYTIYNFLMYLIRYLEGQIGPVHDYMAGRGTTAPHIWPMAYFSQAWVGREMYRECRNGVLNYIILRPVTAIIMWCTLMTAPQRYEEGVLQLSFHDASCNAAQLACAMTFWRQGGHQNNLPQSCTPALIMGRMDVRVLGQVMEQRQNVLSRVGRFEWGNVWTYCMLINNFSQAWALYVLMLFYIAMHEELKPLNPLRKFVTIKLVVFFSFWQGLAITLLAAAGWLKPTASLRTYQDTEDFTGGLQDFVICIEMFFAAVGFAWSFPPRDFMSGEPPGIWQSLHTLFDFRDVMDDVGGACCLLLAVLLTRKRVHMFM